MRSRLVSPNVFVRHFFDLVMYLLTEKSGRNFYTRNVDTDFAYMYQGRYVSYPYYTSPLCGNSYRLPTFRHFPPSIEGLAVQTTFLARSLLHRPTLHKISYLTFPDRLCEEFAGNGPITPQIRQRYFLPIQAPEHPLQPPLRHRLLNQQVDHPLKPPQNSH